MRYTILLSTFLLTLGVKSQCPNRDSILKSRGIPIKGPIIWQPQPYPFLNYIGPITLTFGYAPPRLNEEPTCGKKIIFKNGLCKIYSPDDPTLLLAKGQTINKKKTGKWLWFNADLTIASKGEYVNGLKTGTWINYDGSGGYSKGTFVNGYREGIWKSYDQGYHLAAVENYKNGYKEGKTVSYHLNGKISTIYHYSDKGRNVHSTSYNENGEFTESSNAYDWKLYGKLITMDHASGNKIISNYFNNERNGWTLTYQNKKLISKEYYKKNMRHGLSIVYDGDRKYERYYEDDKLNGKCIMYTWENNAWVVKNKSNFNMNLLEGPEYSILNDSMTMYRNHKNNEPNGTWFTLLHNKDTLNVCHYIDGKKHGREMEINSNKKIIRYFFMNTLTKQEVWIDHELTQHFRFMNNHAIDMSKVKPLSNNWMTETTFHNDNIIKSTKTFKNNSNFSDTLIIDEYFDNGQLYRHCTLVNFKAELLFTEFTYMGDTLQYLHKKNGLNQGYGIIFSNGYIEKGYYESDVKTGEWKYYYSKLSGQIGSSIAAIGNMISGETFETWKTFDQQGKLIFEGCLCGKNYYSTNIEQPMLFQHGQFTTGSQPIILGIACGNRTWYYSNGQAMEKLENNTYTSWYETGEIHETGQFHQFNKTGTWIKYDTNGKIIEEQTHVNGSPQL